MDLRRLRAGEWVAALSGTALIVSLFLSWYGGRSGWEALAALDAVFLLVGIVALALLVFTTVHGTTPVPIALDALVALSGIVATVLAGIRVLDAPGDDGRDVGLWIGLAAAVGIAVGGWIAMRDERLSKSGETTDATGRPVPPPPEIEAIPPPGSPGAAS